MSTTFQTNVLIIKSDNRPSSYNSAHHSVHGTLGISDLSLGCAFKLFA